jgi:PAS domain-containing protein
VIPPVLRRVGVAIVALSLTLSSLPPRPGVAMETPASDELTTQTTQAMSLLNNECGSAPAQQVAQASPEASASPSSSPSSAASSSPTPYPTISPVIGPAGNPPSGPQILVPPALPTAKPATPIPLPSASPSPSGSPAGVTIQQVTAPPSSTPVPGTYPSAGPILPSPAASASPEPGETLSPNDYAILGDHITGTDARGKPSDLEGHVTILYQQGVLGGDRAHYDGTRYIDITGNTFLKSNTGDTVLYSDSVRFDTLTQHATLINGRGESTQGVEQGKLYFKGAQMVTDRDGKTTVQRASFTTCANPRGGYHVESKTLDVYPGDKAVAKAAVLFLGALAIFYLPVVVISLRQDQQGTRRNPGFVPIIGYSQAEGFWIKARIGFSPSDYYYGYYRIEEYTKIGLGLGYVGTIRRKDGRRQTDINFFRQNNRIQGTQQNNFALQDQEIFSRNTRGQFSVNYTGNYGPLTALPPQFNINASVDHGDLRGDRQNYTFQRSSTGAFSSTDNYGFTDHLQLSQKLQNDIALSYTSSASASYYGSAGRNDTFHVQTLTHYLSRAFDYSLTFDRYDTKLPTNVLKEPELLIRPLNNIFPKQTLVPITAQYTLGVYNDPQAGALNAQGQAVGLQTSRGEARLTFGPTLAHVLASDFSGTVTVQQDYYGTGDEKANIAQQATLTTPLFNHLLNTISYSESHTNGPFSQPFRSLDVLGSGLKQANDVLRIFNSDVYSLSLTATTFFNRQAQAVGYQLTSRPSPRSIVLIGGTFNPGPGNGFGLTNVQLSTPFGYKSDLQIATNVNWKARGRLENKNIYYRHIVGDCYEVRVSYNQDLRQVYATVTLLAFPSGAANFGIGQTPSLSSIIPGNFSTAGFYGGAGP